MNKKKICIIGLGYVGLQVCYYFSRKYDCVGFDINEKRINYLKSGIDINNEFTKKQLKNSNLRLTSNTKEINGFEFYIVTVPTPIFKNNKPDLNSIIRASKLVSQNIKKNSIVVYESTVYPGLTEEICVPILQKGSKLKYNEEFGVGYSPERINPNDGSKNFSNIEKIVSGSNYHYSNKIYKLYNSVINAKVHLVKNIKIAEAAKIIENTQRDLNIALVNELSIIFKKMQIDTDEVLKAANTKWNFNYYKPGLVGGHCIGVDPYYLTYKSSKIGYKPKLILAGRKINDEMIKYIISYLKKLINFKKKLNIKFFGITFKENCSDIRNSKSINLIKYFIKNKHNVEIYDYLATDINPKKVFNHNTKFNTKNIYKSKSDIVIITVSHKDYFNRKKYDFRKMLKKDGIIFDVQGMIIKKYLKDKNSKKTYLSL